MKTTGSRAPELPIRFKGSVFVQGTPILQMSCAPFSPPLRFIWQGQSQLSGSILRKWANVALQALLRKHCFESTASKERLAAEFCTKLSEFAWAHK